ncbi:TIR domain-containing protein, partial [Streptomyces sp. NPDC005180]|uniref:magnesium chelatase subunit ChlI family protein n=1 Tax=Streptomyces sp. NPDC005180 TaxID=3156868 RepID=UPI0033BAFEA4
FYDRLGGGHFFDALRDDMKANYDYVLIDSRTGLSDIADICTVHLPDVLVDCFTLSDQSIDGAAAVARQIDERYGGRGIRILPVPMRIDEGEKEKADAGRALARLKFDRFPTGLAGEDITAYWGAVEIPYRPYYAYEETLATFGDEAGLTNSLLSAFERLTAVVTDQQVTSMPAVGEEARLRIRDAFTRRRPAMPADLFLSYVAENRMWADWIESVLTRAGFRVVPRDVSAEPSPDGSGTLVPETAARTVVLLSSAYLKSARAVEVWERAASEDPGGGRRQLLPLRVGDVRLTTPYIDRNPVDLFRRRYQARLSGPLLDRVDLRVQVEPVSRADLMGQGARGETSAAVAARVGEARARAADRLDGTPWSVNSEVPGHELRTRWQVAPGALAAAERDMERGLLTARGLDRVLRVAWTIADLAGRARPTAQDVDLALEL